MWGWWREEIKQKGKRTHGHGQQGGDCGGEGLQGEDMVMEQNTIKIICDFQKNKNEKMSFLLIHLN